MYAIRSLGSDGRADRRPYTSRYITSFDADLVFANGTFIQVPEGT